MNDETRHALEVTHIMCGDPKATRESRCSNLEVVRSYCLTQPPQVYAKPSINTSSGQIKREDGDCSQNSFYECVAAEAPIFCVGVKDTGK